LNPLKFLKNSNNWLRLWIKTSKNVLFFKTSIFDMVFWSNSVNLIFLDNYEEKYIWHDKFKKYFFELCSLFCDLHGPCTTTSKWSKKTKILVITDIIENNISLRVICGKSDWKMRHANKEKMVKNVFYPIMWDRS